MSLLFEAIFEGDIERVAQLIAENRTLLNIEDDFQKWRPIDATAAFNKLPILDYLINEGASLKTNPKRPSLLYWLVVASSQEGASRIVNWIRDKQELLLAADSTLTSDHLKAILGEGANWDSLAVHGGLLPIHYGILMQNPHSRGRRSFWINQPLPQNDWFASYDFPLLLAIACCYEVLYELANETLVIELNAASQNSEDPRYGLTLAYLLFAEEYGDLFWELAKKSSKIDLNAGTQSEKQHLLHGLTSLAWLISYDKQWDLLEDLIPKSPPIDLTMRSREDEDKPPRALLDLLINAEQWPLIERIISSNLAVMDAQKAKIYLNNLKKLVDNPRFTN